MPTDRERKVPRHRAESIRQTDRRTGGQTAQTTEDRDPRTYHNHRDCRQTPRLSVDIVVVNIVSIVVVVAAVVVVVGPAIGAALGSLSCHNGGEFFLASSLSAMYVHDDKDDNHDNEDDYEANHRRRRTPPVCIEEIRIQETRS